MRGDLRPILTLSVSPIVGGKKKVGPLGERRLHMRVKIFVAGRQGG